MVAQNVSFGIIALIIVVSALKVVTTRNVMHAALYLVIVLAGVAASYFLLAAEFIGVTQVLVYIGAISVLILFAIMITQSKSGPNKLVFARQWWAGAIAAIVLVLLMLIAVVLTAWPLAGDEIIPQDARDIALSLFQDYLFAFEVVGVLLLAGVIGGLYLAKRDPDIPQTNIPPPLAPDDGDDA